MITKHRYARVLRQNSTLQEKQDNISIAIHHEQTVTLFAYPQSVSDSPNIVSATDMACTHTTILQSIWYNLENNFAHICEV